MKKIAPLTLDQINANWTLMYSWQRRTAYGSGGTNYVSSREIYLHRNGETVLRIDVMARSPARYFIGTPAELVESTDLPIEEVEHPLRGMLQEIACAAR